MLDLIESPILLVQAGPASDRGAQRFIFANAAARALFRIQRPEGLLATVIRAPEVLDIVEASLIEQRRGEAMLIARGSQERFWRVAAMPIEDPVSDPPLALLQLTDETDVRRAERSRADFLANASHELRTPLASLAGFIETLRGHAREDAEARDRFLAIMHSQADRMRRLIDDLLSLSRIELAEHIRPSGVVDIACAVIDVVDALGPQSQERSVRLETELPGRGEALATADRDQMLQVIQNLVENGLKYSPAGGAVRVSVRGGLTAAQVAPSVIEGSGRLPLIAPPRDSDTRYVEISVRDCGPGMARMHLPRLTERFYRVEGQRPKDRPGTGLGLAIVKHIINRHRGGLIVESAEGHGAVFTAYVPAALTEERG